MRASFTKESARQLKRDWSVGNSALSLMYGTSTYRAQVTSVGSSSVLVERAGTIPSERNSC